MLYLPHARSTAHGSVTTLPPRSPQSSNISINHAVSGSRIQSVATGSVRASLAGKNRYSSRPSVGTSTGTRETGLLKVIDQLFCQFKGGVWQEKNSSVFIIGLFYVSKLVPWIWDFILPTMFVILYPSLVYSVETLTSDIHL